MTIPQQYIEYGSDLCCIGWLKRFSNKVRDLFAASFTSSEVELRAVQSEYEAMIREYMPIVARICFSFADNADDFEDMRQDTLLNLWQGFPKFRGDAAISTWIYRVTFNTCVATTRRQSRFKKVPISEQLASSVGDIAQSMLRERSEQLDHLHWLMKALTPIDRAIMVMWLDERSYDEIASVIGLNRNNVATRLRRARLKLIELNNSRTN